MTRLGGASTGPLSFLYPQHCYFGTCSIGRSTRQTNELSGIAAKANRQRLTLPFSCGRANCRRSYKISPASGEAFQRKADESNSPHCCNSGDTKKPPQETPAEAVKAKGKDAQSSSSGSGSSKPRTMRRPSETIISSASPVISTSVPKTSVRSSVAYTVCIST